jgi:hypothetical protein
VQGARSGSLILAVTSVLVVGTNWGVAHASPVTVVDAARSRVVEDRFLPPVQPDDLTARPPADSFIDLAGVSARHSVPGALQAAHTGGLISDAELTRYRAIYADAIQTKNRLQGRCKRQLRTVLNWVRRFARNGQLRASRMESLFLQLRRNTDFWSRYPWVAIGERVTFPGDWVILQHYRGLGLQIQPLANFGRAAAVAKFCAQQGDKCGDTRETLRKRLDALAALASRRGNFRTWEYWFPFNGGRPPWTSAMSQGTAIMAYGRGAKLLERGDYYRLARAALPAFERRAPLGVYVPSWNGRHYLLYSFAPGLRVLNGFLQSLIGLSDFSRTWNDAEAARLFVLGSRAARRDVRFYDTHRWSIYARTNHGPTGLSSYSYHLLVRDFLADLCGRTGARAYCRIAVRFTRYLARPPVPRTQPGALGPRRRCGY